MFDQTIGAYGQQMQLPELPTEVLLPLSQSESMQMNKLSNALAEAKRQVDENKLSPQHGELYTQRITQQLRPLVVKKQQTEAMQQRRQIQQAMQQNAQAVAMQHMDQVQRANGLRERIVDIGDPLTGRMVSFLEKTPGVFEQVDWSKTPDDSAPIPGSSTKAPSKVGQDVVEMQVPGGYYPFGFGAEVGATGPGMNQDGPGSTQGLRGDPNADQRYFGNRESSYGPQPGEPQADPDEVTLTEAEASILWNRAQRMVPGQNYEVWGTRAQRAQQEQAIRARHQAEVTSMFNHLASYRIAGKQAKIDEARRAAEVKRNEAEQLRRESRQDALRTDDYLRQQAETTRKEDLHFATRQTDLDRVKAEDDLKEQAHKQEQAKAMYRKDLLGAIESLSKDSDEPMSKIVPLAKAKVSEIWRALGMEIPGEVGRKPAEAKPFPALYKDWSKEQQLAVEPIDLLHREQAARPDVSPDDVKEHEHWTNEIKALTAKSGGDLDALSDKDFLRYKVLKEALNRPLRSRPQKKPVEKREIDPFWAGGGGIS